MLMTPSVHAESEIPATKCMENIPLSQQSPDCIRALLQESESKRAVVSAPATPQPFKVREAKTRALQTMMAPALPQARSLQEPSASGNIQVYTTGVIDLKEGSMRGKISYPLYRGTLGAGNTPVYFVLSEASDQEFARQFGIIHAARLANVDSAGVEDGTTVTEQGQWAFAQPPGKVVHRNETGELRPVEENKDYSPLKRIRWKGRELIVNVPFVKWGDEPGQQLLIDKGGCDPLVRRSPPSRFHVGKDADIGGGPAGCEQTEDQEPLRRYRGGQVLDLRITRNECPTIPPWEPCGWVTMKLHQAVHREDIYPYLTLFSASEAAAAEELGILYTPKLAQAGRSSMSPPLGFSGPPERNQGVSSIVEFGNGIEFPDGGPTHFQPGAISYGEPTWSTYSPILHVTWAFFDCGGTKQMFLKDSNISFGAIPKAGAPGFDTTRPSRFNPFGMAFNQIVCRDAVVKLARNNEGIVYRDRLFELAHDKSLVITEWPPGRVANAENKEARLDDHPSGMHLVLNAPAPVTVILP
jgi:hypothetical protein